MYNLRFDLVFSDAESRQRFIQIMLDEIKQTPSVRLEQYVVTDPQVRYRMNGEFT